MFGHDSLPSVQYSYDVHSISKDDHGYCNEQLDLCRRYYNSLTLIKQDSYTAICNIRHDMFPAYKASEDRITQIKEEISNVRSAIKEANKNSRKRQTGTPQQKQTIKTLQAEIKILSQGLKVMRQEMKTDKNYLIELQNINQDSDFWRKKTRNIFSTNKGLYWGSYLGVEQSIGKESFPKLKYEDRWYWKGRLCVQFQAQKGKELATWDRGVLGIDRRLKFKILLAKPNGNRIVEATIRFGTRDVKVVFYLNRPFPEGVRVSWAYLVSNRVGTKQKWRLNFILARKEGFEKEDKAREGCCALDFNWRKMDKGLRVAYWKGDDGEVGSLFIPQDRIDYYLKCRNLESIRDKNFNDVHLRMRGIMTPVYLMSSSQWFRENTRNFSHWEAQSRLRCLFNGWCSNRFAGDDELFNLLREWNTQEVHLFNWQEDQRGKYLRYRDHLHRNFAALLRRFYKTVILEDSNIAEMKRVVEPEKENKPLTIPYRDVAAPGRMLTLLKENMEFIKVSARNTTKRCFSCKELTNVEEEMIHTCRNCGAVWDVDDNACDNILEAGTVVVYSQ